MNTSTSLCVTCVYELGMQSPLKPARIKPGALVVLAIKLTQPAKSTALNDKRAEPYVGASGRCWTMPRRTSSLRRASGSSLALAPFFVDISAKSASASSAPFSSRRTTAIGSKVTKSQRSAALHVRLSKLVRHAPREDVHARRRCGRPPATSRRRTVACKCNAAVDPTPATMPVR